MGPVFPFGLPTARAPHKRMSELSEKINHYRVNFIRSFVYKSLRMDEMLQRLPCYVII